MKCQWEQWNLITLKCFLSDWMLLRDHYQHQDKDYHFTNTRKIGTWLVEKKYQRQVRIELIADLDCKLVWGE